MTHTITSIILAISDIVVPLVILHLLLNIGKKHNNTPHRKNGQYTHIVKIGGMETGEFFI